MKVVLEIKDKDLQREIFEHIKWQPIWFSLEWIMEYYDRTERTIHRWINAGKIKKIDWFYYINKKN